MSDNINPFAQNGTPANEPVNASVDNPAETAAASPTTAPAEPSEVTPAEPAATAPAATNQQPFGTTPMPTPVTTAQPNQPKKSHKGLIIGAIVGVLTVVGVVVAIVLFVNMGKLTANDYSTAQDKLAEVNDISSDALDDLNYSDMEDLEIDDLNEIINESNQALDDGQKKLDELAKLKAIQKDEEAKTKYDKLNEAYAKFKTETNNVFGVIKSVLPVYQAMAEVSDIDSSYGDATYYSDRATAYQKIADQAKAVKSDNNDVTEAMSEIADAATSYVNYYTKLNNKVDVDYSEVSKASRAFSLASSKISKLMRTSDINDASSKANQAYNKLNSYLSGKFYDLEYDS